LQLPADALAELDAIPRQAAGVANPPA